MINRTQDLLFTGFVFALGLLAGAATGLLLAPHSGSHTRRQLRSLADGVSEHASRMAEEATEAGSHTRRQLRSLADGISGHASRMAEEATEAVNELIERGKCLTR
jgi:gas vesicle protein